VCLCLPHSSRWSNGASQSSKTRHKHTHTHTHTTDSPVPHHRLRPLGVSLSLPVFELSLNIFTELPSSAVLCHFLVVSKCVLSEPSTTFSIVLIDPESPEHKVTHFNGRVTSRERERERERSLFLILPVAVFFRVREPKK
jgi:hypothetical protein